MKLLLSFVLMANLSLCNGEEYVEWNPNGDDADSSFVIDYYLVFFEDETDSLGGIAECPSTHLSRTDILKMKHGSDIFESYDIEI